MIEWLKLPGCRVAHAAIDLAEWGDLAACLRWTACRELAFRHFNKLAQPSMPRCKRCQRALAKEGR